jgi:hypothetical protein
MTTRVHTTAEVFASLTASMPGFATLSKSEQKKHMVNEIDRNYFTPFLKENSQLFTSEEWMEIGKEIARRVDRFLAT